MLGAGGAGRAAVSDMGYGATVRRRGLAGSGPVLAPAGAPHLPNLRLSRDVHKCRAAAPLGCSVPGVR